MEKNIQAEYLLKVGSAKMKNGYSSKIGSAK